MFGRDLQRNYADYLTFVGLCDNNPGRLAFGKKYIGTDCDTYLDFERMMREQKPDIVIVTTTDATHHDYIIKGMQMGADIVSEKPMTIDEDKVQGIIDAEKATGKKVVVTLNYRYSPYFTKIKELLTNGRIGRIESVDFHWYLNPYHGSSYMRRWHGLRDMSGTLLVHKATHHFDLINWFLDSDPADVFAHGGRDFFGPGNNDFHHTYCRACPHKGKCSYFWDITNNELLMDLYVKNEHHDGYIRDACVWREEVDIFDKMSVTAKYANNVLFNYSLTTNSPFEGWRLAFNGTKGRMEASESIPWLKDKVVKAEDVHEIEMDQNVEGYDHHNIYVMDNFKSDYEAVGVTTPWGGHWGSDTLIKDRMFVDPDGDHPFDIMAGTRDGAMAVLLGIAARKSIDTGKSIKVADLTSLKPQAKRPV